MIPSLEAAFAEHHPPAAYQRLLDSPTARQYANQVMLHSRFLTGAMLQHPAWIEELAESGSMYRTLGFADYDVLLAAELGGEPVTPLALARFRRRHILRIMLRDVLGFGTLADITAELSRLADCIIESAWTTIHARLTQKHGEASSGFSVIAPWEVGRRGTQLLVRHRFDVSL